MGFLTTTVTVPPATWQKPNPSYAYKPLSIGALIKKISEEKHITPVELEKRMGITHRNIYRIFKTRTMAIPMLLKTSEALGENLLLHFHPNVPPLANPLEEENKRLKEQLAELTPLVDEVKVLRGQLDILREVMKGK